MFGSQVIFDGASDLSAAVDYGLVKDIINVVRAHDVGRGYVSISVEFMSSTEYTGQVQIHFMDLDRTVYRVEYIDFDA